MNSTDCPIVADNTNNTIPRCLSSCLTTNFIGNVNKICAACDSTCEAGKCAVA